MKKVKKFFRRLFCRHYNLYLTRFLDDNVEVVVYRCAKCNRLKYVRRSK